MPDAYELYSIERETLFPFRLFLMCQGIQLGEIQRDALSVADSFASVCARPVNLEQERRLQRLVQLANYGVKIASGCL